MLKNILSRNNGQLLLEALIAIAIGAIILSIGASLIVVSLNSSEVSIRKNTALTLLDEHIEGIRSVAFENWASLYRPPDGTGDITSKGPEQLFHVEKLSDSNEANIWLRHTPEDGSNTRWGTTVDIKDMSAYSSREIWAVGDRVGSLATAWRDRGTTMFDSDGVIVESRSQWRNMQSQSGDPGDTNLNSVATYLKENSKEAFVVGDGGNVWQWQGDAGWTQHGALLTWGIGTTLNSVSAEEYNNIWIAGTSGNVWQYDGSDWTDHSSGGWGSGVNILSVSTYSSSETWVVGTGGHVWRWDGSTWERHLGNGKWETANIHSVSVLSDTDVWIAGASGHVWQYDGEDWIQFSGTGCGTDSSTKPENSLCAAELTIVFNSISAYSGNQVYVAGANGNLWWHNGSGIDTVDEVVCSSWSDTCEPTWMQVSGTDRWGTSDLFGLSDRYSSQILVGGAGGHVWQNIPSKWRFDSGTTTTVIGSTPYTTSFYIQNVCRDGDDISGLTDTNGETTTCASSGGSHDQSTQKITASVSWAGGETLTRSEYVTRWKNRACVFTEWADPASETFVTEECPTTFFDDKTGLTTSTTTLSVNALSTNGTLTSTIWDTTGIDGPAFNLVRWTGTLQHDENRIRLQIAASDSDDGIWIYRGGEACLPGDFYNLGASGTLTDISGCDEFDNKRYIKYKLQLCRRSDCATGLLTTPSPTVTDLEFFYTP